MRDNWFKGGWVDARTAGLCQSRAGSVVFHDALYDPTSACGNTPFAVDVLTVHQQTYYGQNKEAKSAAGNRWPNDYDNPIPVGFVTVKPHAKFLVAVTGQEVDWAVLAMELLGEAFERWGLGGKTSAGYGRGRLS